MGSGVHWPVPYSDAQYWQPLSFLCSSWIQNVADMNLYDFIQPQMQLPWIPLLGWISGISLGGLWVLLALHPFLWTGFIIFLYQYFCNVSWCQALLQIFSVLAIYASRPEFNYKAANMHPCAILNYNVKDLYVLSDTYVHAQIAYIIIIIPLFTSTISILSESIMSKYKPLDERSVHYHWATAAYNFPNANSYYSSCL